VFLRAEQEVGSRSFGDLPRLGPDGALATEISQISDMSRERIARSRQISAGKLRTVSYVQKSYVTIFLDIR
jgi:hypothetical protein